MVTYELWQDRNGGSQFFCPVKNVAIMLSVEDDPEGFVKTWEITVADSESGYVEAMTRYHEYMGWEPYRPMK